MNVLHHNTGHVREGVARRQGFDLWFDVHGDSDSTVVLLAGAALQGTLWEQPYVNRYLEAGHQVLRTDWRDIGRSSRGDFRSAPYTTADLADDVAAVLDEAAVDHAHILGFSMGGLVAQQFASLHRNRTLTLSLLAAPFGAGAILGGTPRADEVLRSLRARPSTGSDDVLEGLLRYWRLLCGKALPFDEQEWRERIAGWLDRGHNPKCPHLWIPQHERSLDSWHGNVAELTNRLRSIEAPTLVVNGDDDGMFPASNAASIVATVPHCTHHVLPGRGHDLFLDPTGEVSALVLSHLEGAT